MSAPREPLSWEGEDVDAAAARRAALEHAALLAGARGEPLTIANEFAEVTVRLVDTRNGSRLLVEAPKSGQWVALDPMQVEALTWQGTATFSAMIGNPFGPLIPEASAGVVTDGSVREGGGPETLEGGSQ
ncbi:hypothetical protein [Klenkia taihuensis]|uniref:Dihydrodiol dehydrogenase n=1 Tax=Klenkia taihuensis TaxID=1225127 RepID=A0A1I1Q8G3_9ACTN|nr:hypothetical protein [Klenkia taihuensis]GHE08255.1 hypothetical protein GCM10011381_08310 [Klenkia taihuensis]SFD15523.1 hypothetical protein SAMN05661030_2541 [Klenkia taihuensis]